MFNRSSSTTLVNCALTGNLADYGGGAMYNDGSIATLTNCTLSGNQATDTTWGTGGGIYSWSSATTLTNCILWGNSDSTGMDESAQLYGEAPDIDYSCVQGWTGTLGGTGNTGEYPRFVDADGPDDISGTDDDDLRLLPGSPCTDTGLNDALPPDMLDLDGNPRFVDGDGDGQEIVDMGAYEYQADCNDNGIPDSEDIAQGTSADCNANGIPDECDIGTGISEDADNNGIPDECEAPYDLDGDDWIGPGDFSLFVCCWLHSSTDTGCPPPAPTQVPCVACDFDCDGFVGPGDFSWFVTGWMKPVDDPTILVPPCQAGGGSREGPPAALSFALRAVTQASEEDHVQELPASVASIPSGTAYFVEVWVTGTEHAGVTSAYIDLDWMGSSSSVMDLSHGSTFTILDSGVVHEAGIDELGGSVLESGIAIEPTWSRVAVVMIEAEARGEVTYSLSPSMTGCATYGGGSVPWESISLDVVTVSHVAVAIPSEVGPDAIGVHQHTVP